MENCRKQEGGEPKQPPNSPIYYVGDKRGEGLGKSPSLPIEDIRNKNLKGLVNYQPFLYII